MRTHGENRSLLPLTHPLALNPAPLTLTPSSTLFPRSDRSITSRNCKSTTTNGITFKRQKTKGKEQDGNEYLFAREISALSGFQRMVLRNRVLWASSLSKTSAKPYVASSLPICVGQDHEVPEGIPKGEQSSRRAT